MNTFRQATCVVVIDVAVVISSFVRSFVQMKRTKKDRLHLLRLFFIFTFSL